MEKGLEEIVRRLKARRAYTVAEMAAVLGVHPNTVRWRCTIGIYEREQTGPRKTMVLSQSVLGHLAKNNEAACLG